MVQSLIKTLYPLLTIILILYAAFKDKEGLKQAALVIIFAGLALSLAIPGEIPSYPQWNFYPDPVGQNISYNKLMISDNEGKTIIYDPRASILGSAGVEDRQAFLLSRLNKSEKNIVVCKLIRDANRYKKRIENNEKSLNSPQGFGTKWKKENIAEYKRFTYLEVEKMKISLNNAGTAVKKRSNVSDVIYSCS